MMNHQPYRRISTNRAALRWWLFGRDRRHPLVVGALVLVAVALVAVAVLLWIFAVAGLLAAAGTGELAWRHDVPGWAWPVTVALGLLLAVVYPPLLLVAGGAIGGAVVGNRHREQTQLPDDVQQRGEIERWR